MDINQQLILGSNGYLPHLLHDATDNHGAKLYQFVPHLCACVHICALYCSSVGVHLCISRVVWVWLSYGGHDSSCQHTLGIIQAATQTAIHTGTHTGMVRTTTLHSKKAKSTYAELNRWLPCNTMQRQCVVTQSDMTSTDTYIQNIQRHMNIHTCLTHTLMCTH